MAERSKAIEPLGETFCLLKFLYCLARTSLRFIDQPPQLVQWHSLWPAFQFPVDSIERAIILPSIIAVLGHSSASNERQESFKFLLLRFGLGHAVLEQKEKGVPVMYQLRIQFLGSRVFPLSSGKIPIVPESDSSQH